MTRTTLSEWDKTKPQNLSEQDINRIEQEINKGKEKIRLEHTRNGDTIIHSKQYVGLFSLPSGLEVKIEPKAAEGNLINLLKYAKGTSPELIQNQEQLEEGTELIDTLAQLFLDELKKLLRKGLRKEYVRKETSEKYLRGRLQVQKQLQKQLVAPTEFECSYEELTHDTTTNQSLLYSTAILTQVVESSRLQSQLKHYREKLRRNITLKPINTQELQEINLNRLNQDYKEILDLCQLIISSSFIESLESGQTPSYSFLLDMNSIFERIVERAFQEIIKDQKLKVKPQKRTDNLVTGTPTINMYPDIVVENPEKVLLVADAKWKTSTQNSDIYQIVSYTLAHDAPGLLIYPEQQGKRETEYTVKAGEKINLIEIPIQSKENFQEWHQNLLNELKNSLKRCTKARTSQ